MALTLEERGSSGGGSRRGGAPACALAGGVPGEFGPSFVCGRAVFAQGVSECEKPRGAGDTVSTVTLKIKAVKP